jgi:hypothetical protein
MGLALAVLAGCAPRPTGISPVTDGVRMARYLSQRLQRERRAVMVEGSAAVWIRVRSACDTCPWRRLPGVSGDLALSWPDVVRVRVSSIFGTALDVGVCGDSIIAYAPARGAGVTLDLARDSLGAVGSGSLLVRLASAGWRPPDGAWAQGTWRERLLVLRWGAAGDSVRMAVDEAGRPVWARLWREGGGGVQAEYERWETVEGVSWPVVVRVEELGGAFEFVWRLEQLRFGDRRDHGRLAVRVPEDAERVGVDRLRGFLERLEAVP